MSQGKTKVYIYTRVSTTMQIDGYSLDAQKARMKAYADFNDYQIVGEYEDAGKSGKSIEAVLPEIECDFAEKRADFSPEFWKFANWKRGDEGPQGIYDALKRYQPQGIAPKGKNGAYEAANTIINYKPALPEDLQDFAAMVADDIQHYGTLAQKDMGRIAEYGRSQDREKAVAELKKFLERLLRQRGAAYLAPIRKRKIDKPILITIDKCRAASTEKTEDSANADK